MIILSQAATLFVYNKQYRSAQLKELILVQDTIIESLSRKVLQVSILQNSEHANKFSIYNLNLEIEPQINFLKKSSNILKKGGELKVNGIFKEYSQVPGQYHAQLQKIDLLLNAFLFVKDKMIHGGDSQKKEQLYLLTSIIGQLSVKNKSL